jgi:ATP-dependent RNA circularization protein (DNA/RNA ligase family)
MINSATMENSLFDCPVLLKAAPYIAPITYVKVAVSFYLFDIYTTHKGLKGRGVGVRACKGLPMQNV